MILPARRPSVSVLEHKEVLLPPELNTPATRERLLAAAQSAGMPEALVVRRRKLYAGNCVGVIDIGTVAVEILPKTRDGCTVGEGREFLNDILRASGRDRQRFSTRDAAVADSPDGLLEVILAWAARAISEEMNHGLPRRYVPRTEESPAIKGRLSMAAAARQWPGRRMQFVVTHAPLSPDNSIGRTLRWLLDRIAVLTRRPGTRALAAAASADMEGVKEADLDEATLDACDLGPMEAHWQPFVELARTLLRQSRPDPTRAGNSQAVAVLFTLHDLFEGVLRHVLATYGPAVGLYSRQFPSHLLLSTNGPRVRLRPDFVLALEGLEGICVADAKWKDVWRDGAVLGAEPRPSDAYQVTSYMVAGRATSGFLLAPLPDRVAGDDIREFPHDVVGSGASLTVIGVRLPRLVSRDDKGAHAADMCARIAARIRMDAARAAAVQGYSAAS